MKMIKCKTTEFKTKDIENKSGVVSEHLKTLGIEIPTSFKRRQFGKKNGTAWHMQFFDSIEIEDKETYKCPHCDWTTVDIMNVSGCLTVHLAKEHNVGIEKFISDFPEEEVKFQTFINQRDQKLETLQEDNYVECRVCGEKVRYITNTHLQKHGITQEEYKMQFGTKDFCSKNYIDKTTEHLKEATKNIKTAFVSKPEKALKDFIKEELGIDFLSNDKALLSGVEIDIIIPSKKICIEFNGNRYHSENYGGKKRMFHKNKTKLCQNQGYKLIHIFEDEWFLKNNIVKSKLKSIMSINDLKSIYARKCIIKAISPSDKNDFLNTNHIQGEDKSDIHLGAFFEDKLVSVCTFSSSRKMIELQEAGTFEIKRFASDINYKIVGIFSKFVSYFKKNHDVNKLFTFLDMRWNPDGENNVYVKNGFKLEKVIDPDYTYFNPKISRYKRFHKFSFGKSSLKQKFPDLYSDDKTEWQIMQEAKYDRIWDCGKFKFSMII